MKINSIFNRIGNIDIIYILLLFVMFMDVYFLYLLESSGLYTNIVFLVNICIFAFELLQYRFTSNSKSAINLFIACILILLVVSVYSGTQTYGQSVIDGLLAQREWLSWMLLAATLNSMFQRHRITVDGIKKTVIIFAKIYALLCILQYIIYPSIIFMHPTINERYGSPRLYFDTTYFIFASGLLLDKDKLKEKLNYSSLLWILLFLGVIAIVTKGRMATIAFIMPITFYFLCRKQRNIIKKITAICIILCFAFIFINFTTIGQDTLATLNGDSTQTDTLSIRDDEKSYYLHLWTQNLSTVLLGLGVPNVHNDFAQQLLNPVWTGSLWSDAKYYLSDTGVLGCFVQYGIVGLIITICLYTTLLYLAIKCYTLTGSITYLLFIASEFVASLSLVPSLFNTSLLFPMIFSLALSETSRKIFKNKGLL